MPKIRFFETRIVQDGTGLTFEAGKTYELPKTSCDRWVQRGTAEYVSERAKHVDPESVTETGEPKGPTAEQIAAAEAGKRATIEAEKAKAKVEADKVAKEAADKAEADKRLPGKFR